MSKPYRNLLIIILAIFVAACVFFLSIYEIHENKLQNENQIGHKSLKVKNLYARVSSPSAKSGAIFFIIENGTDIEHHLIGARVNVAKKAELHSHSVDKGGVMSMIKIDGGIKLQPQSRAIFKRGGNHVMMMGLKNGLRNGETFSLDLIFDHKTLELEVSVDNEKNIQKHEHKLSH